MAEFLAPALAAILINYRRDWNHLQLARVAIPAGKIKISAGMFERLAARRQFLQFRAAALGEDGVAGVAIVGFEGPAVVGFVVAVVTPETAGLYFWKKSFPGKYAGLPRPAVSDALLLQGAVVTFIAGVVVIAARMFEWLAARALVAAGRRRCPAPE